MKVGQLVKNTLDELSKQRWSRMVVRHITGKAIKIVLDREYHRCIEILIKAGLDCLKQDWKDRGKDQDIPLIAAFVEEVALSSPLSWDWDNRYYISLVSYNPEKTLPSDFFMLLEKAIAGYVSSISHDWEASDFPAEKLISKEQIDRHGSEMIVLEHSGSHELDVLLRSFAGPLYYSGMLDIPLLIGGGVQKCYMVGRRSTLMDFISGIQLDLTPSRYSPAPGIKLSSWTLQSLCINSIFNHARSSPQRFIMDSLRTDALSDSLLADEIEDAVMDHPEAWSDMYKYRGKIVVFKVDPWEEYYPDDGQEGYRLYPERKDLRVGVVSEECFSYLTKGVRERGYELSILCLSGENCFHYQLSARRMKYLNFRVRLPEHEELDMLINAIPLLSHGAAEYSADALAGMMALQYEASELEEKKRFGTRHP